MAQLCQGGELSPYPVAESHFQLHLNIGSRKHTGCTLAKIPGGPHSMRTTIRLIEYTMGCILLSYSFAPTLSAEDGAALYTQLCATCHDAGSERAPNREAFRAMTPERVLTAMESGAMLSMASSRTGAERRTIAEFVTGKSFAQALST